MVAANPSPIELVQNPAFGAQLLWSYGLAYQAESVDKLPSLPSFFLILPLVLHGQTLAEIRSTFPSSGLTKLIQKLDAKREKLVSIHDRSLALRDLTLQSLTTAISSGLLRLDYDSAAVRANEVKVPPPPERLKAHVDGATKLGAWFARLPMPQVFSLLQVHA